MEIKEFIQKLYDEYGENQVSREAFSDHIEGELGLGTLQNDGWLVDVGKEGETYEMYLTNKALVFVGASKLPGVTYGIARLDDDGAYIDFENYPDSIRTFEQAQRKLKEVFKDFIRAAQYDLKDAADFDDCSLSFSREVMFVIYNSDGREIDPKTGESLDALFWGDDLE